MAFSGLQKTRLGLAAFARSLYGSFAGKQEHEQQFGPGFGINSTMSNSGLGLSGSIENSGIGQTGANNIGISVSGIINNSGIAKVGEI